MDLIGQAVLLAGGIHCSGTLDLNFHESFLSSWRLAICVLAPFMEGLATSAERLICDVWAIFVGASIAASSSTFFALLASQMGLCQVGVDNLGDRLPTLS